MEVKVERDLYYNDLANASDAVMDMPGSGLFAPSLLTSTSTATSSSSQQLLPPFHVPTMADTVSGDSAQDQTSASSSALAPNEPCAVCGDASDGHHYGVRSCRGCNAFFRRAITLGLQFSCRRGGRCLVDKNVRCACRACRLQKCISVGMDRRAVQPRKGEPGSFDEENGASTAGGGGAGASSSSSVPGSSTVIKSEPISSARSAFTPIGMPSLLSTESLMPAVVPSPPTSAGLITRLSFAYKEQLTRRRLMLCRSLEEVIIDDDKQVQLRGLATGQDFVDLFKVQVVLMFEWVESLDEFRAIKTAIDKTRLLRWFAMRYMLLDNIFHTLRLGYSDRLVLANNMWLCPCEFPAEPNEDVGVARFKARLHGPLTASLVEDLVKPLHAMNLRDGDEIALRMFAFFNPGEHGLSDETTKIIKEGSERAVRELERYWEETTPATADFSRTRLCNLLLMLTPLTKHVAIQLETMTMIPNFGQTHRWEEYMSELVRIV